MVAGALHIGGYWIPILSHIATGVFYGGMGIVGYGIWSRLTYIFYPRHTAKEGQKKPSKPNLGRSKIKPVRMGG
jgi:hypothetical protein